MGETLLSSPDPLNDTPTFHSPSRTRRSSKVRHSLPLQSSSPKKQTFELDVGSELSPQKIKVTVEAGDSDAENAYPAYADIRSPTRNRLPKNRRMERTTTTTIPVKGLSDSEDETQDVATPKRGRGRPRKSSGTPVPAKKSGRAGTPTRKNGGRRKLIRDVVDGDDSDDVNFQIGKGVEIGRGKGGSRSRSRSTKGAERKSTPANRETVHSEKLISSTTSKKGRGRRKTLLPEEVVILEDESSRQSAERQEPEMPGALDEDNISRINPPSAYSTIRSITTIGGNEPDITLAIFDPGNETPHRTGWSSPRIVEAPIPSSTRNKINSYPSPSNSPEKSNFSQFEEESVAVVPAPPSDTYEHTGAEPYENDYRDGQYEEDDEDGVGELHEFDTILESEGFSMISVDSVPSLREHHSSPAIQPKDEVPRPIRSKSLLSVQDVDATSHNDSFSSIPDEVLEAATPGRKAQNRNLLSVQNAAVEDSFSSVAPEILEAATPARELTRREVSATKAAPVESYEDSFSAIPSAVLDAATPAAVRHPQSKSDRLSVPGTRFSVSTGHASGSAPPRLPTPEKTPSPPGETTSKDEPAPTTKASSSSRSAGQNSLQNDSSIVISHMPSSPPSIAPRRYTFTAHLRQHRQLNPDVTQTPSIVFSSPSLPPPKPGARDQPVVAPAPEKSQRPTLSPIVRAGRALQDVVVPSSSRSRSQSLGSPFKSPAAAKKSSSSAVRQPGPSPLQERRVGPLPKLDLKGELDGLSSQRRLWTSSNEQEDPFSSRGPSRPGSPSEDIQNYSLDLPEQRRYSDPRLSTIKYEVDSIRSDDAMSWQAEEEISLREGTTSISNAALPAVSSRESSLGSERSGNNAMTSEQRYAAEREAVRKQIISADPSKVIVIDSDDDHVNDGYGRDDEDFGLLLETLNSSSPAVQAPHEPIKDAFEKPRRSKIPSPWRKNSKRLVYSDELSQLEPPITERVALAKGLTQDLTASASSQPVTVRRIVTAVYSDETDPADISGWQIPQKSNFKPRARESTFDLSALLASPEKPLPKLTTNSQRSFQQTSSSSQASSTENTRMTKSSDTRSGEVIAFTPIPQKSGFNPRARLEFSSSPIKQTSYAPTIFGGPMKINTTHPPSRLPEPSAPISKPLRSSSPSRTNSLPALHTPLDQLSPSVCSEEEPHSSSLLSDGEKENQPKQNKILKWTESLRLQSVTEVLQAPPPMTSPTKSCLRSPLKTPSANYGPETGSPSKGVTFVSSSPMPDSPVAPLSSIKWSKDHWRLLDSILQSWKPENQSSPSSSDSSGNNSGEGSRSEQPRKRRNSTRVISKLLGKKVSSQGESMRFEQWHLEAVDEFRGFVPGWEEKVVAMRVFACLVGEERRALGWVGSSTQDDWRVEAK